MTSRAAATTMSAEEEAALASAKGALFARPRGANSAGTLPAKETEEEEAARISAASAASMLALESELHGGGNGDDAMGSLHGGGGSDGGGDGVDTFSLDLTTAAANDYLDFDLDSVDGSAEFARFQQNELVKEAVEKGRDLRKYAAEVEAQLEEAERACVADYVREADSLVALHGQLKSCDGILETMESMLSHFQNDLSAISNEIEFLQSKSYTMNIKLRNYKAGEKALNSYIQHIYIPDDLVNMVLEGEIAEPFVAALQELDKKLRFLDAQARDPLTPPSKAARDMQPIGDKLKLKAIARIRHFLLERFHALKKPKTNIQIKQKSLLKFASLYQFLLHHADTSRNGGATPMLGGDRSHHASYSNLHAPSTPSSSSASGGLADATLAGSDICGEIRSEYHKTMSVIYKAKFGRYLAEMRKLEQESPIRAADTMAPKKDEQASGGMFSSMFSSKKSAADIDHVFRLNGREDVLTAPVPTSGGSDASGSIDANSELIIPHMAAAHGGKLPFTKLFKSAQVLLMDTATSEYDFIVEFFGEKMARDMDRAGVHEDAVAAEKEAAAAAASAAASGDATSGDDSKPSRSAYSLSQQDERGREHLAPNSRDKHLFALVFGDTIKLFLEHLSDHLLQSHDALGILLLIRIVCQHNIAMQYRRVHCIDHVFDRMIQVLWPRFKHAFDAHVDSVTHAICDYSTGTRKPNYIGSRFADFTSSILFLNVGYNEDILFRNVARFRDVVERYLSVPRADKAGKAAVGPPPPTTFLIFNYHSILSRLSANAWTEHSEEAAFWSQKLETKSSEYIEEEMRLKFPALLSQVAKLEQQQSANPPPDAIAGLRHFIEVQAEIAYWRKGIEALHASVTHDFAAPVDQAAGGAGAGGKKAASSAASAASRPGSVGIGGISNNSSSSSGSNGSVLSDKLFLQMLTQLLLYHSRLKVLVDRWLERGEARALVSYSTLQIEMKKFKH